MNIAILRSLLSRLQILQTHRAVQLKALESRGWKQQADSIKVSFTVDIPEELRKGVNPQYSYETKTLNSQLPLYILYGEIQKDLDNTNASIMDIYAQLEAAGISTEEEAKALGATE